MSDGLLMNLAAIEGSDHMTSPHADKYDRDGWYRATIAELIKVVREQHAQARQTMTAQMVSVESLCIQCGTWHSVQLRQTGEGTRMESQVMTKVRPVCWVCGNRPLSIVTCHEVPNQSPPSTHTSDGSPDPTSAAGINRDG
jgi:hypothetical protein